MNFPALKPVFVWRNWVFRIRYYAHLYINTQEIGFSPWNPFSLKCASLLSTTDILNYFKILKTISRYPGWCKLMWYFNRFDNCVNVSDILFLIFYTWRILSSLFPPLLVMIRIFHKISRDLKWQQPAAIIKLAIKYLLVMYSLHAISTSGINVVEGLNAFTKRNSVFNTRCTFFYRHSDLQRMSILVAPVLKN